MLEPPGEVKPETEVYWHLAQRLGLPDADVAAVIPAPSDESVAAYLRRELEPFPEVTIEKLAQAPIIAPGHQEIAFSDHRFRPGRSNWSPPRPVSAGASIRSLTSSSRRRLIAARGAPKRASIRSIS